MSVRGQARCTIGAEGASPPADSDALDQSTHRRTVIATRNRASWRSARHFKGLKHGYRSGLEYRIGCELEAQGIAFEYEPHKLKYVKPVTTHTYTPDFKIITKSGNVLYIETKGMFTSDDRKKHLLVRDSHPELDVRFVFERATSTLSKKSKTTYAAWCDKHGFMWANKHVPTEWLEE